MPCNSNIAVNFIRGWKLIKEAIWNYTASLCLDYVWEMDL